MKKIITVLALFPSILTFSQNVTTIDFETENSGYTPSTTWQSGWTDVFNRTNFNMSSVTNEDGYYWAVEDISVNNPSIVLDQINVSGSSSFTFSIDMTTHHYNDWDATDELLITYSVDSGSYQNLMAVQMVTEGSGTGTNEPAALDTDFDGAGDCGIDTTLPSISTGTGSQGCSNSSIGKNFKTFTTSSISLSSNSTLDIKLQFNGLTSSDEGIYLDNIIVTETSASNDLTVTSDQTISSDVSYNNVTVNAGNTLTIAKTGSLTVSEDFTNNGTVILQSASDEFASLIVQGNSSGNITYKRFVADEGTDEWDFIGSPVVGQTISNFISANSSLAVNGSNYAIGVFSNDGSTDTASAMYTMVNSGDLSGSFSEGIGYSMATDEADNPGTTLDFTGTVKTTDLTVNIDDETATLTNFGKWNLIANPYPSFINANSATSGTNFMTTNSSNLHASYAYIYGYDGDGTWTLYNNSSSATYIAPGQAFFVASDDSEGNTVTFSETMQTITGSDDFIAGSITEESFELVLKLYEDNTEVDYTRFYFKDGLDPGLDIGYDAGHFNQEASLMSRLLEEDEGVGFVINAMGLDNVNDAIIPIVINRESGDNFRISIDTFSIYAGTNVYLEDNQNGTMTLLNDQDFELTPESTLSESGRFFIHLTQETFSNEDATTDLLNVFKLTNNNFITVEGLATQSNQTNLKLYNILGKEVLSTTLANNTNTQTVSTQGLSAGIYVIKLESGNNTITKKLIIK